MAKQKKLRWDDASVRCPFYLGQSVHSGSIRCEGCMEDSELVSRFRTVEGKERHMGIYCSAKYESCPVYGFVCAEKYDD